MPSVRSNGRAGRRMKADINVVPYIDVMLVLLVIFMVTAPLITPGLIELPSVGQAADVPAKPLEVQISEDGKIALRMREPGATPQDIARTELVNQVRSRITAETPVVIAADGKVPYESVVKVMDELRSSGITRLGLLVDQGAGAETQQPARKR
ncbi:TolR-like translocation protein [Bordetella pertussis]|uniref:TolR-like translocation protein n=8 Tax=Bordetella TaxID=517 RepID=Q7VU01_BORPE|nr:MULTISPECIES: protein TolR [Bordetella]ETH38764.1 protein TolR [Bordetella pertussis H918]ETH45258.1 protein TolR [Bordetella pertussis H939]ETH49372.1 protein TolR [Bordetella pertussis H921]ETH70743.1 protein TolR [Bordetella pertussis STO1-CHLA-0011]ETH81454.1 protein TolR [Bordetella pertussis STO1-CHOC-0017]ETH87262.1 protein TolR [Bordetella pertussis STO1-CHOC-0018]ETH92926.1 protein TolR [Bordetella pertussis STO1-CHOC-0019]ETI00345.1 protein TolR [Bordetella pertussis STO1-CHOM-